jgi:hypothetical protein
VPNGRLPQLLLAPVALAFGLAARLRRRRAVHPDGAVFTGTMRTLGGVEGTDLFGRPQEVEVVVRFSRAVGVPPGWPELYGVAIRVPDRYGPGRHQDLLVSTAWTGPLVQHVLRPTRDPGSGQYTSVLPFRLGRRLRLVAARVVAGCEAGCPDLPGLAAAAERGALRLSLDAVSLAGRRRPLATLAVGPDRLRGPGLHLLFNPRHTGGGVEPLGLMAVRDVAYRASQRGRGALR